MQSSEKKIPSYTKGELAAKYEVSLWIFRIWLKPFKDDIGAYNGRCYTPAQVKIIFEKLGDPE